MPLRTPSRSEEKYVVLTRPTSPAVGNVDPGNGRYMHGTNTLQLSPGTGDGDHDAAGFMLPRVLIDCH